MSKEIGIGAGPINDFGWSQNSNIMKIDQEVGSRIDTSDKGSQIYKDVKEVSCGGIILTESRGDQMKIEGKEQEVNC